MAPTPGSEPIDHPLDDARRRVLLVVASELDATLAARQRAAAEARLAWRGPLRHRFEAERARNDAIGLGVIERCRRLAAS